MQSKRKVVVESSGIAICRQLNNKESYILLCKRRITYEFMEFVHGKYSDDWFKLTKLFNKMTAEEKTDILSGDFNIVWWRLNVSKNTNTKYVKMKEKYEKTISRRGFIEMVQNSSDGELLWEIPKGRSKPDETDDLSTAVRELKEEINISRDSYTVLYSEIPTSTTITDYGVVYYNKFYLAELNTNNVFKYKDKCPLEISSIKWCCREEIKYIPSIFTQQILTIINIFEKYKKISV